jgi:predicted nuclease of restriction endonuclease-like (RecB) superfamily
MTEVIEVKNDFISFPSVAKYAIGQQVRLEEETGYVIGIKLGSLGWDYLVVMGEKPENSNQARWYCQHSVTQGW